MSNKSFDSTIRPFIGLQSIPRGPNEYTFATTPSIPAGSKVIVTVTTTPSSKRLSLWDFLFSIRVDTDSDDYLYPDGALLTSDQDNLELEQWIDYATSSDRNNIRVHKIVIKNTDSSAHVYHILYKAYTFAATPASTS